MFKGLKNKYTQNMYRIFKMIFVIYNICKNLHTFFDCTFFNKSDLQCINRIAAFIFFLI